MIENDGEIFSKLRMVSLPAVQADCEPVIHEYVYTVYEVSPISVSSHCTMLDESII